METKRAGPAPHNSKPQAVGQHDMLQKLQRLRDLKLRYTAVVQELDQLNRELFGEGWQS